MLVLLATLVLGPIGPASAHDELVSTEPAADAVLEASPPAVALEFSEDVLAVSASFVPTVILSGPSGEVALGDPAVDGKRVSAAVPEALAPGAYSVIWRVVSADGHPVSGTFAFSVSEAAPTPSASPASPTAEPTPTTTPTTAVVAPRPSTSPTTTEGTSSSSDLPRTPGLVAGALALVAVAGLLLARRRR